MEKDRAPPDPERMVSVRIALEAVLRRRDANVISDNAGEAICKKLMAAIAPNAKSGTIIYSAVVQ